MKGTLILAVALLGAALPIALLAAEGEVDGRAGNTRAIVPEVYEGLLDLEAQLQGLLNRLPAADGEAGERSAREVYRKRKEGEGELVVGKRSGLTVSYSLKVDEFAAMTDALGKVKVGLGKGIPALDTAYEVASDVTKVPQPLTQNGYSITKWDREYLYTSATDQVRTRLQYAYSRVGNAILAIRAHYGFTTGGNEKPGSEAFDDLVVRAGSEVDSTETGLLDPATKEELLERMRLEARYLRAYDATPLEILRVESAIVALTEKPVGCSLRERLDSALMERPWTRLKRNPLAIEEAVVKAANNVRSMVKEAHRKVEGSNRDPEEAIRLERILIDLEKGRISWQEALSRRFLHRGSAGTSGRKGGVVRLPKVK